MPHNTMEQEAVLLHIADGVGTIRLNRPESFNSVNAALAEGLINALDQCAEDDAVRAIVLTGSGKSFCAGQDLKEITNPDKSQIPPFRDLLEQRYDPIVKRLRRIEKPIIGAVNGVAAGAGANFALATDIIVAHEQASFVQAFSAIGLIPDSGGTYTLPRAIGWPKARALAMLGEKISAAEAERMGMIYKWYPADTFDNEVNRMAQKLASMPTRGLAMTKQAFNASFSNNFGDQLALETELQLAAAGTEDYQEGVTAFVEKRRPVFKGR